MKKNPKKKNKKQSPKGLNCSGTAPSVCSGVLFCVLERERSTPLMSNEGDSEQVVELHSTEPAGVHISLFSDREN